MVEHLTPDQKVARSIRVQVIAFAFYCSLSIFSFQPVSFLLCTSRPVDLLCSLHLLL